MKTSRLLFDSFLLLVVVMIFATAGPADAQDDFANINQFDEVTMRVTHRIYPSFVDTLSAALLDTVQIGDTEFTFVIDQFLADFGIKPDGTLVSRSAIPHNPAFAVVVFEEDEATDRQWAFFGTGIPHYRRDSMLAFEILSFQIGNDSFTQAVPRKESSR